MLKVGITGGIGSGKTTVCRLFELLGIPVFYADEESKKILEEDPAVHEAITKIFGKEIMDESGKPDRKKLGTLVFTDKSKLEALNGILHPAVGKRFENWVLDQKDAPYVLKEAAILFESGAYKQVDKVITVSAPKELRIARTVKRDSSRKEDVESRMNSQLSDKEREERAQYSVSNDEESPLIPQVLKIHELLTADK